MSTRRRLLTLLIAATVAVTSGCPLPTVTPCADDTDCPAGSYCLVEREYCVPRDERGLAPSADAAVDGAVIDLDAAGTDRAGPDAAQRDSSGADRSVAADAGNDDVSGVDVERADAAGIDAAGIDAARADGAATDSSTADTLLADSSIADVSVADTAEPDAATADVAAADTAVTDTLLPDSSMPDMLLPDNLLPDTSLPDASSGPPVVEVHHEGTGSITGSQALITFDLDPAVDPTKSILFFNVTTNSNAPVDGHVGGQLIGSGSQVRFQRGAAASDTPINVSWTVVQLDGIFVQRGTETANAGTLITDAALGQAVDQAKAFPLFSYHLGGGTYNENDWREAYFTGDQNLRFERVQGNDPGAIDWQVVEFLSSSSGTVRSGGASMTAGVDLTTTVTLDPVTDPDHAFLIFSYQLSGGSTLATQLVSGRIDSASQLYFEHAANNLGIDITWYLVEWDAMFVQRGSLSFTSSEQDQSASLGQGVDPARSVSFCPSYQRQGMTSDTSNYIGTGWFTTRITGTGGGVAAHRDVAAGSARVDWSVVEFR